MNIAVLFFGRLNDLDKHYDAYMKFLNKDNNNLYIFLSSDKEPINILKGFITLYKPISYINDKITPPLYNLSLYESNIRENFTNINNVIRHFTNKKRVLGLFNEFVKNNNNIKFDLVVSLRLDILFNDNSKNINDYIIKQNYLSNNIYIPKLYPMCIPENYNSCINDQIAFGNPNVMYIYMNVIDYIDFLLKKYKKCCFNPEILTIHNLKNYKINIKICDINYRINKD